MFGGLGALITSEIGGAIRRNVVIYALYALTGLLVLGAAGFALGALHTALATRYGAVEASLIIAGALLVAALAVFALAAFIKSRPRPARPVAATALAAAPVAASLLSSRKGWRVGLAGLAVVLGAVLGRQIFKATEGGDGGEEA